MNRQWMRQRLEEFDKLVVRYLGTRRAGEVFGDDKLRQELHRAEPTIKQILGALDPRLAEQINLDDWAGESSARNLVNRGLGILSDMDEWAANLAPEAPTVSADQFHPWVWDAARTFWESKHYRKAVDVAANAINAHTQTKVGRTDIFDVDLMNQVFTDKPKPGQVYLRFPGSPTDLTAKSRNRALRPFAEGCFAGIRNHAAHEHGPDWSEQMALEYLATLSVLARWIDECVVMHGS
ncbi:TIGR02391 family protein [Nonomuraea sp. MTCD27]|uniref:TIGR02391 family protein n=1 Tax=Nonomuraea sp. MTCD27 TaxID=1676747 RepID=UPI0035C16633